MYLLVSQSVSQSSRAVRRAGAGVLEIPQSGRSKRASESSAARGRDLLTHLVKSRKNHKTAVATAVSPVESPPELRGAGQPVHRETRDVGVQISGTHTDECKSSRPGISHLADRSSGLVRPNTHAEARTISSSLLVSIPRRDGSLRTFEHSVIISDSQSLSS